MKERPSLTTQEVFAKYTPHDEILTQKDLFEIEQNMIGLFSLLDKLDRKYFPNGVKTNKGNKND